MIQQRTIHKSRLINGEGDVSALCFVMPKPINFKTDSVIHSDFLNDEVTCSQCRTLLGIPVDAPSLTDLMRGAIQIQINSYLFVVDLLETNKEREAVGSEPIPGDDYANSLVEFDSAQAHYRQIIDRMRERMRPANGWGWPAVLEESKR